MFETAILIYNVEYMYTIWAGVLIAWSIKYSALLSNGYYEVIGIILLISTVGILCQHLTLYGHMHHYLM